ncbi:hypothetical protein E2C01_006636 [Portunus trituberculatus]|uniref:Uncharacterized protein n=1 Tax=Portunus trituberculatus TaxID=210409 RepID=A0A5B7CVM5_PORTR|nr:hypothetical protein [Portunus trituberculatus]
MKLFVTAINSQIGISVPRKALLRPPPQPSINKIYTGTPKQITFSTRANIDLLNMTELISIIFHL